MMSISSPTTSRTVRTRSTLRCMPAAPSAGPQPKRSFIALVALRPCTSRLGGELVERLAVEAARVHGNPRLGPAAEQPEHRLPRGLAEHVPQRDVHGADRRHPDALPAERHRLPVHVLPQELDVPGIRADQQRLEIDVDRLLGHARRERGVADADVAASVKISTISQPWNRNPAIESAGEHRAGPSGWCRSAAAAAPSARATPRRGCGFR